MTDVSRPTPLGKTIVQAVVPDPDQDPFGYHQWYAREILWPCAPKTYERFWERAKLCKPLRLWADEQSFPRFWIHVLFQHLLTMWNENRGNLQPRPIRLGRIGRPSVDPQVEWELSVLDFIMHGLLGSKDSVGRRSRHWVESVKLLKHFYPDQFPETWDRRNLRGRVNKYTRRHRQGFNEGLDLKVRNYLTELRHVVTEKYRDHIQAHLTAFPRI